MKRITALLGIAVATVAVAAAGAGCSGDDEPGTTQRPLTSAEASLLAEVLVDNYGAGGAVFEVATLDVPGGRQLSVSGRVDWASHVGEATVSIVEGNVPDAVGWTIDAVLERWSGLDPILQGLGWPAGSVVTRPVDIDRRLDQVIAIVMGLASERPDNAVLIAQEPGSAYLRDDVLRNTPVVVLRYGTRNIYWLDAESGEMLRFEATNQQGNLPTVVDLLEIGEITIDLPPEPARVPVDAVSEAYLALAPAV